MNKPAAYVLFLTLGAWITAYAVLRSPSDSQNALFLGYSLERLILAAAILLTGFALLALTLKLLRQPEHSLRLWETFFKSRQTSEIALWIAVSAFLVFWIILFLPSYRFAGNLSEYALRMRPVLAWLAVVGAVTTLVILHARREAPLREFILKNKTILRAGSIILALFALGWIAVAVTGIGIRDHEDYWYAAGVPVLGLQVLFSLIAGVLVMRFGSRLGGKFDLLVFAALWILSAWLWAREPLSPNYFMPDTAKNEIYPYSDSATYDTASQFALIGQGLFNGQYFDRPLYSALLTFLHVVAGQDVHRLMDIQAALFAVFPAVIYLLGRELHSRALGVSAALLLALRGVNSIITAKWVDTASPKMMLTDFPTAIGIAIFLLLVLKWMKRPSKMTLAIWAGGALGMTVMLRTHAFLLLPVVLAIVFIFIKPRWNRAALGSLLLVLGMLISTLPWDIRNRPNGIPLFYVYYSRIELILRHRYGILEGAYSPPSISAVSGAHTARARIVPPELTGGQNPNGNVCNSTSCSIVNHFVHNGITSVTFLPTSFVLDDLWNTVKLGEPFWRSDWSGEGVTPLAAGFLLFNLAVISLGAGVVWERDRAAASLIVIMFLAYHITNALSFTSGGRYITPMDWIICIFFMAGLLQAAAWFLQPADIAPVSEALPDAGDLEKKPEKRPMSYLPVIGNLALVFMMGSLIPLAEFPFEQRYQARKPAEALDMLERQGWLEQAGLEKEALSEFLTDPRAKLMEGRLLYPRFYPAGTGQPDRSTYFMVREYPRLVLTLIGPTAPGAGDGVVAPGFKPYFPLHAADAVVIGCRNTAHYAPFTDALVVIVLTDPGYIYHREPSAPLQCPFEEPQP